MAGGLDFTNNEGYVVIRRDVASHGYLGYMET
jgi:hypothetical protein